MLVVLMDATTMNTTTIEEVRSVKEKAGRVFRRDARVVGVGITRIGDGYGLKINLSKAPRRGIRLPEQVDGVPVRVEVVGTVRKR
jgi:hypothetical protein